MLNPRHLFRRPQGINITFPFQKLLGEASPVHDFCLGSLSTSKMKIFVRIVNSWKPLSISYCLKYFHLRCELRNQKWLLLSPGSYTSFREARWNNYCSLPVFQVEKSYSNDPGWKKRWFTLVGEEIPHSGPVTRTHNLVFVFFIFSRSCKIYSLFLRDHVHACTRDVQARKFE